MQKSCDHIEGKFAALRFGTCSKFLRGPAAHTGTLEILVNFVKTFWGKSVYMVTLPAQ